jgi:hypothetical protein
MDEETRESVLIKLREIERLIGEIRDLWPVPNIEASLRFAEMYCRWAEFGMGGADRFEFEVGPPLDSVRSSIR